MSKPRGIKHARRDSSNDAWADIRRETRLKLQAKAIENASALNIAFMQGKAIPKAGEPIEADPLLAEALALGATITPHPTRPPAAQTVEQPLSTAPAAQFEQRTLSPETVIACDVELARLAVGLKQTQLFRVWLIMLQNARKSNKNYLSRIELAAALTTAGVKHSERNLRRWLRQGEGVYWHLTPTGRVKFDIGYAALAQSLTAYAREIGLPDLVSTNTPGQRKYMYVTVSSAKLIEFEANVYAAWLASKENPTISRFVLTTLFNRDAHTLREWEEIAGIEVVQNYTHYTTEHANALPQNEEGDNLREDVQKRTIQRKGTEITIWRAQMVNTYIVPIAIKQHGYRGQSRRVARVVKQMLESSEPAGIYGQGETEESDSSGGLQPTGHLYFSDHKRAKSSAKHSGDKARFVPLAAVDGNHYIWEFSPDGQQHLDFWECVQKPTQRVVYA